MPAPGRAVSGISLFAVPGDMYLVWWLFTCWSVTALVLSHELKNRTPITSLFSLILHIWTSHLEECQILRLSPWRGRLILIHLRSILLCFIYHLKLHVEICSLPESFQCVMFKKAQHPQKVCFLHHLSDARRACCLNVFLCTIFEHVFHVFS